MVSWEKQALKEAGCEAPYVLCPHYVQDYEYEKIAGDIEEFLRAKM